jgi:hypothetical protein
MGSHTVATSMQILADADKSFGTSDSPSLLNQNFNHSRIRVLFGVTRSQEKEGL